MFVFMFDHYSSHYLWCLSWTLTADPSDLIIQYLSIFSPDYQIIIPDSWTPHDSWVMNFNKIKIHEHSGSLRMKKSKNIRNRYSLLFWMQKLFLSNLSTFKQFKTICIKHMIRTIWYGPYGLHKQFLHLTTTVIDSPIYSFPWSSMTHIIWFVFYEFDS